MWIPPYSYAEDKAHNFRCCACHPKYAFVPQSIVLYRENLQSLTYQEKHLSREYGDLIFFHLLIGAMYLAKEEMTYQGKKIRVAAKILKQYSRNPFVEQKLTLKECIRYTRQIKSLFWKLLAFTLVLFIQMHMYFVVAAVFVWMSSLGIDSL